MEINNPYISETPVNGVAKVGDKVRFFGPYNQRGIVQTVVAVPDLTTTYCYKIQNPTSEFPGFSDLEEGWTFAQEPTLTPTTKTHPDIKTHPEFFKK